MLRRQRVGPTGRTPHRRGWARGFRLITATLAVVGTSLITASRAHALPSPVVDNFESSAGLRWTAEPPQKVFFGFNPLAQSGVSVADLNAIPASGGKVRIYRTLAIDRPGPSAFCSAGVFLRKSAAGLPTVTTDLRIHSAGISSPVLVENTVDVTKHSKWTYYSFGQVWSWQAAAFTVEVTAFRGRLLVDDVMVKCVRDPS